MKWKTLISVNRRASKNSTGHQTSHPPQVHRENPLGQSSASGAGKLVGCSLVPRDAAETVTRDREVQDLSTLSVWQRPGRMDSTGFIYPLLGWNCFPSPASVVPLGQDRILSQDRHLVARELEFPPSFVPWGDSLLALSSFPFLFLHIY